MTEFLIEPNKPEAKGTFCWFCERSDYLSDSTIKRHEGCMYSRALYTCHECRRLLLTALHEEFHGED